MELETSSPAPARGPNETSTPRKIVEHGFTTEGAHQRGPPPASAASQLILRRIELEEGTNPKFLVQVFGRECYSDYLEKGVERLKSS